MNENIKAWLGLNLQDTLINLSAFPFLAVFFINNLLYSFLLFGIGFVLSLSGLIVYFKKRNDKISKATIAINKWSSVVLVLIMWAFMIVRISILVITYNRGY